MTIAVIIPTYNRLELTQNCLASIARHDPVDEVIVVDNGSTDGTERLATHSLKINTGFATACNIGARHATADHLIFLNNDTIVHPNWTSMTRHLEEPDVGIVARNSSIPTVGSNQPEWQSTSTGRQDSKRGTSPWTGRPMPSTSTPSPEPVLPSAQKCSGSSEDSTPATGMDTKTSTSAWHLSLKDSETSTIQRQQ